MTTLSQEHQILWDRLEKSDPGPSKDDLKFLIEYVEPLREQAQALMQDSGETTINVMAEIKRRW